MYMRIFTADMLILWPLKFFQCISSQYDGDQKRKIFLDLLLNYLEKEGNSI